MNSNLNMPAENDPAKGYDDAARFSEAPLREKPINSKYDLENLLQLANSSILEFDHICSIAHEVVDQLELDAMIIADAADIAINQVHDKQLEWFKREPELKISDLLFEAFLFVVSGFVTAPITNWVMRKVEKTGGILINRGSRLWSYHHEQTQKKNKDILRDLQRERRFFLSEKGKLKKDLGEVETKVEIRLKQDHIVRLTDDNNKESVSKKEQLRNKLIEYFTRDRLEDLAELERNLIKKEEEIERIKNRINIKEEFYLKSKEVVIKNLIQAGQISTPRINSALDQTLSTTSIDFGKKRTKKKLTNKDLSFGDTPSVMIRHQVNHYRNTIQRQIQHYRRLISEYQAMVMFDPIKSYSISYNHIKEIIELARNELTSIEYNSAVRDLALQIEFAIWVLIIPFIPGPYFEKVKYNKLSWFDRLMPRPLIGDHKLEVNKETAVYLLKRFGYIDANEEVGSGKLHNILQKKINELVDDMMEVSDNYEFFINSKALPENFQKEPLVIGTVLKTKEIDENEPDYGSV